MYIHKRKKKKIPKRRQINSKQNQIMYIPAIKKLKIKKNTSLKQNDKERGIR